MDDRIAPERDVARAAPRLQRYPCGRAGKLREIHGGVMPFCRIGYLLGKEGPVLAVRSALDEDRDGIPSRQDAHAEG